MGYKLNRPVTLAELSSELGLLCEGADIVITGISPFDSHQTGDLTFCKEINKVNPGVLVVASEASDFADYLTKSALVRSQNPRLDFIKILVFLDRNVGISTFNWPAQIHPSVVIGKNVVIEDGSVVGEGSVIEHNVVIHKGTRIGKNTRIRSCSSIGGDGFGFDRDSDKTPIRFPHLGGVVIGDNVEVGACTTIARGALSDTIIENDVKIDNLVHIAHNCVIKKGAFIIACAEISGGVTVGENAWIAPNSCTHQKISIGANALIGLGAVVTKNVPDSTVFAGNPAKMIKDLK